MKIQKMAQTLTVTFGLMFFASWPLPTRGQQNPQEATAGPQKMNADDRNLTAKIHKSVVADQALSTYAHNVKIIGQDGIGKRKGPARSDDEVTSIVAKAVEVVGSPDEVVNQMLVKPHGSTRTSTFTTDKEIK